MQKELPGILVEFTPQAWVNDCACGVGKEGPDTYDVTLEVLEMTLQHLLDVRGGVACLDYLVDAKNSPDWVKRWSGPFEIHFVPSTLEGFLNALGKEGD